MQSKSDLPGSAVGAGVETIMSASTIQQCEERRRKMTSETEKTTPPRERGRPPMSVVVISDGNNGTPQPLSSIGSGFTFTSPDRTFMCVNVKDDNRDRDSNSISSGAGAGTDNHTIFQSVACSSFKLMPRRPVPVLCSPSPCSRESMSLSSRKRRVQSISSPSSYSRHSQEHDEDSDGDSEHMAMCALGKQDFSSPRRSEPSTEGNILKFGGLSINSPLAMRPGNGDDLPSPPKFLNHSVARPVSSSFSAYAYSPVTSVHRNGSGSLSGSAGSMVAARTPCSSTMSSPRHVPLTVLSLSSQQGPSPMKLPSQPGRPPFHSGLSKMLHSLEGREDQEETVSPRRLSRSLLYPRKATTTPGSVQNSCDMSEEPCTPKITDGNSSLFGLSPRTPLPRVTLTPRTPLSARPTPGGGLPLFPATQQSARCGPQNDDTVGLLMDNLLDGFTGHTPPSTTTPTTTLSPSRKNLPLLVFNPDFETSEMSPMMPAVRRSRSPPNFDQFDSPEQFGKGATPVRANRTPGAACTELTAESMGITTRSVMTPSRSNGFLSAMMRAEARAGVLEAETGSLSDSDDEDFVLTCPLTRQKVDKTDHQSPGSNNHRRVKQRVQCSSNTMEVKGRDSFAPLTLDQASSTSLFGMDIVQEDQSQSPSVSRATTPFSGLSSNRLIPLGSNNTLLRQDEENGSSGSLYRGRSDLSLGSVGLCLEADTGRDLITPPIMMQYSISPPPLMKRSIAYDRSA